MNIFKCIDFFLVMKTREKGSENGMTKWYQRVLASVLVAAMAFGMVGGFAQEAMAETRASVKQTTATGDIQATLRMDYPIAAAKLGNATVTLLKGDSPIASGKLGANGTLSFTDNSGASGDVSLRSTGQTVSYVDISISGLAADNDYKLTFEGCLLYTSDAADD